jgi:enoyl-CoA hydratase/carnithine racemase
VSDVRELADGKLLLDAPAEGVARLTIANPARRNALDHPILDGLAEALQQLDARCVILTGSDGMFSAGYDLGDLADADFSERAERLVAHPFTAALDVLEAYPYPTIAALTGHTIGGGLEMAIVCDMRVAVDGIKLGMPPAKLGLIYSHTGLRRFIQAIGAPRTRELFLLGRNIDAQTALQWGLVNRVVSADELEACTLDLAAEIARNAPLSQTGNKKIIGEILGADFDLASEIERQLIDLRKSSFISQDMLEGVKAFAEKRKPEFRGE